MVVMSLLLMRNSDQITIRETHPPLGLKTDFNMN